MKSLKFLLVLGLISFGFLSCSDDDDNEDNESSKLLGTWIMIHEEGYESERVNRKDYRYEYDYYYPEDMKHKDAAVGTTFEFRKNGEYYSGYDSYPTDYRGKWKYTGNKLIVSELDDMDGIEYPYELKVINLSSNELVLVEQFKEGYHEFYAKTTFKRYEK